MADAGDLERLPLEIRKEIYKLVLLETKSIAIKRYINPKDPRRGDVVRMDNHRKASHRGKIWNARKKIMLDAPPGPTSMLLVNKTINQEATPVFYGNDFAPFTMPARFAIFSPGLGVRNSTYAESRSFTTVPCTTILGRQWTDRWLFSQK